MTWILKDRGARDNFPKIAANALYRGIILLPPAAKGFIKDTVKDVAAWNMLKERDYFALQERLRANLPAAWKGVAGEIGPVQHYRLFRQAQPPTQAL